MDNKQKIYSFIGLAKKANRIISGEEAVERDLRNIKLLIIAEDASDNTKKKFERMCMGKNIEFRFFGEKDNLGKYVGKEQRAVIAIKEDNFARRIIYLIDSF